MKTFKQFFKEDAKIEIKSYWKAASQEEGIKKLKDQGYRIASLGEPETDHIAILYKQLDDKYWYVARVHSDGFVYEQKIPVPPPPATLERWKKEDLQKEFGNEIGQTIYDL